MLLSDVFPRNQLKGYQMQWTHFGKSEAKSGLRAWKRWWVEIALIADSSFVIDLMREHEEALKKLAEIRENNRLQYIASPTVMELAVGVALADLPTQEQEKIDDILTGFQVIPLDTDCAWRAGIETGILRKNGKITDPIDGQIAGIALQNEEPIVTRNLKHFELFEGLQVETY
ncbi:MAG: PIN domain-containing protein [Candidatus Lokiarchaeota archaeon]|nr:PIN domain-containing protein [Candidatus Lokiarchaeota archaeon]